MKTTPAVESCFPQVAVAELARVHGGIAEADAARIKKIASGFCPATVKANAGLDYNGLTKDTASKLADQCLAEMAKDTSEDGVAAYKMAQSKIKTEFGKFFP